MPPAPDTHEMRDNASFAAILAALSRPGSVHRLPEPGPATVALALIDRECRVWADDAGLIATLRQTGAAMTGLAEADHIFTALAEPAEAARLALATPGVPLYPDEGATIIAAARFGAGQSLRLTGPGIDGTLTVQVAGVHPSVWANRAALCRYPLGIEMLLLDGARLMALPRSTEIEVL